MTINARIHKQMSLFSLMGLNQNKPNRPYIYNSHMFIYKQYISINYIYKGNYIDHMQRHYRLLNLPYICI